MNTLEPIEFLFASAMNPCPCGNLLSRTKECRCTDIEVQRYKNRLSDPFLDRIDLFISMDENSQENLHTVTSKEMFGSVLRAFKMQKTRLQQRLNGKMKEDEISKFCILDDGTDELLQKASRQFNLSMRSKNKVLKVSRTIADLEGSQNINKHHLLEAVSYRYRD